jgi:hypothetical protein
MKMRLLDTLSMIALWIRKTKETFLEEIAVDRQQKEAFASQLRQTNSSSFQKAKDMFWKPCVSETPAMPSSPHLKALERA